MGKVILLDCSSSKQLTRYVKQDLDSHPLWTSVLLATDRKAIQAVGTDFIRAGAQMLKTMTYQASIEGFMKNLSIPLNQAEQLIKDAVSITQQIIDTEGKTGSVEVLGSVGPYGAYLHDGSEYTGQYGATMSEEELVAWHRPRVELLAAAGCRTLAFETVPCSKEALALITLLKMFPDLKAYLSFSVKDDSHISSGERLDEVAAACWSAGSSQLIAVGVNCLQPHLVCPLLSSMRRLLPTAPFVLYPNSGETFNKQLNRWEAQGELKPLAGYVEDWLSLGVQYLGSCCRTDTEDLSLIKTRVDQWNLTHS